MNKQFLQYIREELMIATADLSGRTKGQLVAFAENGMANTDRIKRKRRTMMDEFTGKLITIYSDPVPGTQTRGKGTSKALIEPVQFCTASWRRALATLDTHERAWLSWCYAGDLAFAHQVAVTEWAWAEFKAALGSKKIAGKTLTRLKALIWLAAQDVRSGLAGHEHCQHAGLAMLAGISKSTWSETYADHWRTMSVLYTRLDCDALCATAKIRSQQKATNLQLSIAKPN